MSNTEHSRFPVLDISVSALNPTRAVTLILDWVRAQDKRVIHVCPVSTVMACHDDSRLATIVNQADMVAPDGMPLVWIGRTMGYEVSRVYGPDLMMAVLQAGCGEGVRHYLYGGRPDTLKLLQKRLRQALPNLCIAGSQAPPFRALSAQEEKEAAAAINRANPDIVWVGLGSPKQDHWVARFRPLLNAAVLIPVGAAFDFHAGRIRQAPRLMQAAGLEWLFRLAMEPRRLWRRYLIGNPRFIALLILQAIKQSLAR